MARPRRTITRPDYDERDSSYPEGNPSDIFEQIVARLNSEAFASLDYARIDEIIATALHGAKRHPKSYRALKPSPSLDTVEVLFTTEQALRICEIYNRHCPDGKRGCEDAVTRASNEITEMSSLFSQADKPIVRHLLQRYDLLYSENSPVGIDKVSFIPGKISGGLKATKHIKMLSPILVTCGSMSSDVVMIPGISIIEASPSQLGPVGPRLVLGPFRFVNHDCDPNCQFRPIKGSHAYVIWTIKDIEPGTPITVRYSQDLSYFNGEQCKCESCTGQPRCAPRRPVDNTNFPAREPDKKRKRRRAGKKVQRRKLNKLLPDILAPCPYPILSPLLQN